MIPIHDLLHRIRWDPDYAKADFEIGYLDRVAGGVVRIPFRDVRFDEGHLTLNAIEEDGSSVTVPLHRVREVWRNGEIIWRRGRAAPDPAPRASA